MLVDVTEVAEVVVVVLVVVPVFEPPEVSAPSDGPSPPESFWSVTGDTGSITVVRCVLAIVVGVVGTATGCVLGVENVVVGTLDFATIDVTVLAWPPTWIAEGMSAAVPPRPCMFNTSGTVGFPV